MSTNSASRKSLPWEKCTASWSRRRTLRGFPKQRSPSFSKYANKASRRSLDSPSRAPRSLFYPFLLPLPSPPALSCRRQAWSRAAEGSSPQGAAPAAQYLLLPGAGSCSLGARERETLVGTQALPPEASCTALARKPLGRLPPRPAPRAAHSKAALCFLAPLPTTPSPSSTHRRVLSQQPLPPA